MNLIRNLIGIYITILMLPLSITSLKFVSNISFDYDQINDEISICQLRELLLIAYDMQVHDDTLIFRYQNKIFRLSKINEYLLLQPGSQIYLNNVDSLYFKEMNNCIYVVYEKNNKTYEKIITSTKGIYLDEFSDCLIDSESDSDLSQ